MGEMVEFPSNGDTGSGYLAVPDGGSGPGVIVIQEWWGLVPHIKEVCDRFAAEGFVALAPDLFRGETTTEPDEAGKLMMALNVPRALKDLNSTVDYLKGLESTTGDGLGVTGFCMGGGLALVVATERPEVIKACAPFYGVIPWESLQPDYSKLGAKVVGHFAELDGFFPPDMAMDLETTIRSHGHDVKIHIHEGTDHAFFNDTREEVYDQEKSDLAWAMTLDLFETTLR